MYADDTNVLLDSKSENIQNETNAMFHNLYEWFIKLFLQLKQTTFLSPLIRHMHHDPLQLKSDNTFVFDLR